MADGPYKSMSPDPDSIRPRCRLQDRKFVDCERCGGVIFEGEWPWCKGRPEDHER
jgi:hypothetical protein